MNYMDCNCKGCKIVNDGCLIFFATAYNGWGADNNPEPFGGAFHRLGPTFIKAYIINLLQTWLFETEGNMGLINLPRPRRSMLSMRLMFYKHLLFQITSATSFTLGADDVAMIDVHLNLPVLSLFPGFSFVQVSENTFQINVREYMYTCIFSCLIYTLLQALLKLNVWSLSTYSVYSFNVTHIMWDRHFHESVSES